MRPEKITVSEYQRRCRILHRAVWLNVVLNTIVAVVQVQVGKWYMAILCIAPVACSIFAAQYAKHQMQKNGVLDAKHSDRPRG